MPWPLLKVEGAELIRDKKINLLLQTGAEKNPEIEQVPNMIDLARTDEERKLLEFFSSPATIGRSVLAPPDVPAERVAELRAAFTASMKDPALLADVKKLKLEIDPLPGDVLQKNIVKGGDLPAALIERAREVAERKK
jgi:hypothetical protein